ncbi:hypothetical protein [Streptosporangium lutulentum]|uniref:DUF3024 domain-containing protein n=1 Tax=Streptosporangium lutulentum TaxID=1461250 RepID=A0ABT9QDM6_9ACTN|nr:hypothetical protein [Streptosporangium lutulentum]MDP9844044.1 hypothetical protein [Streptosporangium lutulentum]
MEESIRPLVPMGMTSLETAELLRRELAVQQITCDIHDGYDLALVSVWVGLVVRCDGERFWWRIGWSFRHSRFVYAWHSATDPERAAQRIAVLYAELREQHMPPWLVPKVAGMDHGPR